MTAKNRTAEVTRLLVSVLKEKGYRFVRLDDVPQVQSAMSMHSEPASSPRPRPSWPQRLPAALVSGVTPHLSAGLPDTAGPVEWRSDMLTAL